MTNLPAPDAAARIAAFLDDHLSWSAYWDKHYGLWRVAEDDPDSDLYAESPDADVVIRYISAHSQDTRCPRRLWGFQYDHHRDLAVSASQRVGRAAATLGLQGPPGAEGIFGQVAGLAFGGQVGVVTAPWARRACRGGASRTAWRSRRRRTSAAPADEMRRRLIVAADEASLLAQALQIVPDQASPATAAWAADARHAEKSALVGDTTQALDSWSRAEKAFAVADTDEDRPWTRFLNQDRFDTFRIATYLHAGKAAPGQEGRSAALAQDQH